MIKNKINSRGGERVLSIYWFIIFILVAIAVVSGVYIFFSKPIDVREAESGILNDKIVNCFVSDGKLINLDVNEVNIEERCELDLVDKSGKYDKIQYYIRVDFGSLGKVIKFGDENYEPFCGQGQSRKNIPYCKKNDMIVSNNGDFVKMTIITSVGKINQNAI